MLRLIYDAVIVLSGGLQKDGTPQPWVQARLDAAVPFTTETTFVILNSRGTVYKKPPLTEAGMPIDESLASATYLVKNHGIDPKKILLDSWSYDTMGNAFFALVNHVIPRRMESVLVITSEFHMPRTRVVFDHIFGLPDTPVRVEYLTSPNLGMTHEAVVARMEKELNSIRSYQKINVPRITTLEQLYVFMFSEHNAYAFANMHNLHTPNLPGATFTKVLDSY